MASWAGSSQTLCCAAALRDAHAFRRTIVVKEGTAG
jgi:hypothetical protein